MILINFYRIPFDFVYYIWDSIGASRATVLRSTGQFFNFSQSFKTRTFSEILIYSAKISWLHVGLELSSCYSEPFATDCATYVVKVTDIIVWIYITAAFNAKFEFLFRRLNVLLWRLSIGFWPFYNFHKSTSRKVSSVAGTALSWLFSRKIFSCNEKFNYFTCRNSCFSQRPIHRRAQSALI